MDRAARLKRNTIWALIYHVLTVICGMIVPKLILAHYGSQVNGLIGSITQFLQIISFLQLGVGTVMQSALYKPLAEHDELRLSQIMASGRRFYSLIAKILLGYVLILMVVYYVLVPNDFGRPYTMAMIAILSVNFFSQYYFGIANSLLINADQQGYRTCIVQSIAILINTTACVVLINFNVSIHLVKLVTASVYLLCPLYYKWYVDHHYRIDKKVTYREEPIPQKWNGAAQHVSSVVLDSTDVIALSVFSKLSEVSIYNVYHMVVYGVKMLFMSMTNGIQSLLGELWAKKERDTLHLTFSWFDWIMHTTTVFAFTCTGILIVPFVMIYTSGITDANYKQVLFAFVLVLANGVHCLRTPYQVMIKAAGHYKSTQNSFVVAAMLNLVSSIILVQSYGLVGVATGTLLSMGFHTVWTAHYTYKNLLSIPMSGFAKQILVDVLTVLLSIAVTLPIKMEIISYVDWFVFAVECGIIVCTSVVVLNVFFYRENMKLLANKAKEKLRRK